jgi:hypothetical protein
MDDPDSGEISNEKQQTHPRLQNSISRKEDQPLSKYTSDWLGRIREIDPETIERVVPLLNEFLDGELSRTERRFALDSSKFDDLYKKVLSLLLIIGGGFLVSKHPAYELEIGCFMAAVGLAYTFKIPLGDLTNILNKIISKE